MLLQQFKTAAWFFAIGIACTIPTAAAGGGLVLAAGRPLPDAVVRVQGHDNYVVTDRDGRFDPSALDARPADYVTAGKAGYYNRRMQFRSLSDSLIIELRPVPDQDNEKYKWQDPNPDPNQKDNCGNCHTAVFREWRESAHAHSVVNPLVSTLYNGTDVHGKTVGPGYKLDWSDQGNCSVCHAPAAATRQKFELGNLSAVERSGVTCDYCHKIADVQPDPNFANTPAVRLLRPERGVKLLFGPFSDATFPDEIPDFTLSSLYQRSQYCASCHDGRFWGVPVYETYSEWRKSSYPAAGMECQTCHMKPTGQMKTFANKEKGGKLRNASNLGSHSLMGGDRIQFMRDSVHLNTSAALHDGLITVDVDVANTGAGHDFPTGQPMRHALLLVSLSDDVGHSLRLLAGDTLPSWAGDWAGLPGKAYAKVLVTLNEYERNTLIANGASAEFPAPIWRRNRILSDNRIHAHETDHSRFVFTAPRRGAAHVHAQLVYRNTYQNLAKVKGWDLIEVVVASDEIVLQTI